jgi:hypothetical protein
MGFMVDRSGVQVKFTWGSVGFFGVQLGFMEFSWGSVGFFGVHMEFTGKMKKISVKFF